MPDLRLNASSFSSQALANVSLFDSLIQSDLGDPQLRMYGWEQLKERAVVGPLNIPKMMHEVEQKFLDNGSPLIDHVDALFDRLTEQLKPSFTATQLPGEEYQVTEIHLAALQARLQRLYENDALQTIWNRRLLPLFQQQGAFQEVPPPNGVEAIREWLNNPANAERIHQVTELEFSAMGLKALPSEIGLFIELHSLDLSDNQLSSLPESLSNLTALNWLHLSNNQLDSLPESFGNLTALIALDLSKNQLSSLPKSFGNLLALDTLVLNNNLLDSLPELFGNLQALNWLYLSNNQLASLPESFSDLTNLTELSLTNNRLSFLPKSFGNLRNLHILDLLSNQLSSLPESFSDLRALNRLLVNGNPLMLVSNRNCYKVTNYRTFFDLLEPLKKYTPQSPLATLFHEIIFNKPAQVIQQAYAQLSPNMQQQIANLVAQKLTGSIVTEPIAASSSSDPSLSPDNLFTDMDLFARSVRKAAYELYDSLERDHKKLVHWHVWDLAGRPETNDHNWGEHHVFDHVLRFTDALERATQN